MAPKNATGPKKVPPTPKPQPKISNPNPPYVLLLNSYLQTPDRRRSGKTGPSTFEPIVAFYILLGARLLAAFYSPIQDCDEVFNYWEPSHYLNHGYGLETWEYSPVYAIRSWAYAGVHSAVIALTRILFVKSKSTEFYFLRVVFALFSGLCETRIYSTTARVLNPRIALIFLIIMVSSTGMFHASVAYLPSSFAMYMTMLGTTAFMDWKGGLRTAQGIMWYGIGAVLGWPFAGALVIPFICEEIILASVTQSAIDTARRLLDGVIRSLIALVGPISSSVLESQFTGIPSGHPILHRHLLLSPHRRCPLEHRKIQRVQQQRTRPLRHRTLGLLSQKSLPELQFLDLPCAPGHAITSVAELYPTTARNSPILPPECDSPIPILPVGTHLLGATT